ncbi:MAG: chromosome segregation protein SMC [Gammaproteobacteria bacterium]|nr:chromosome segregation protein SMC [Gammaproteobacteria bacterium]
MRITRIKVAGFKSFVDPTTLTLPGNLTGIVGPNGCGKSNIIDALLWVLGESSAKHLRGDSMVDVIFNGSNTRKPVGQAMVEIVFDNSDGTIGGQYAGFGEISIKRTVSRDGVSAYHLNGARCRRKDVTNAFLGTGIGSRGYSVIEQGMISRVIEAKPEELRAFLEEAAGISKYKERRRETENRMGHTKENMARLTDIRDELEKQLNHLQRQARAAERYQELKAEERKATARGLAVRWRALNEEHGRCHDIAEQRTTELEAEIARLREIEARQVTSRDAQIVATDQFNTLQTDFYARSGEIARLEQAIKHAEEREQSLGQDLKDAEQTLAKLIETIAADSTQLEEVKTRLTEIEPRFESQRSAEQGAFEAVRTVEAELDQWQHTWDAFNRDHNALAQREHATQIRLEHLLTSISDADTRVAVLNGEASRNETAELVSQIDKFKADIEQGEAQRVAMTDARNALRAELGQSRQGVQTFGASLHEHQTQLQQLRGRLASLQALQEAAYGNDQRAVDAFCKARGIDNLARLAAFVDVEAGWERALEAALRIPLGALCGPQLTSRIRDSGGFDRGAAGLTVIDLATDDASAAPLQSELLLSKIKSKVDLSPLLAGVHVAADADTAMALRARLAPEQMIVLPDGTLFGANWVQVAGSKAESDSILTRERAIEELGTRITQHEADIATVRADSDALRARIRELEVEEQKHSQQLDQGAQALARHRSELGRLEAEFQRRQARATDVAAELERLAKLSSTHQDNLTQLKTERAEAQAALQGHAERRTAISDARGAIQARLDSSRQQWRDLRDAAHQLELTLGQLRSRRAALEEALARNGGAREGAERRRADIAAAIEAHQAPRTDMRSQLDIALRDRLDAENKLAEARRVLGELDADMQKASSERASVEQAITEQRRQLEQIRLDQRALEVRLQELVSRFEQTGENLDETLAELSEGISEESIQEELEKLSGRIARLGPINLAAIDEFTQLSERKTYLDSQHADLSEALATLEEAIRKIDRETRSRFRETFDKVNNGMQALFPVLFGGGHAYLELTGEDLLETGVTVMARPPGKRNSTIHLLSGGEKALTAVSFIFSIFELNPAPFCLLDEVDAPLDDNNVIRLTEMLRSMSKSVQFLFITHNKITMEIAEQLIGVTMQEAGVSRLVAVNMEEAVQLAATA